MSHLDAFGLGLLVAFVLSYVAIRLGFREARRRLRGDE